MLLNILCFVFVTRFSSGITVELNLYRLRYLMGESELLAFHIPGSVTGGPGFDVTENPYANGPNLVYPRPLLGLEKEYQLAGRPN